MADIGPTVANQAAYQWPEDFLLPLSLSVAGTPWASSDAAAVKQYEQNALLLRELGVWYEKPDETGLRKLYLYPVPGSGGDAIELEWVFRPAAASVGESTHTPSEFPEEFHPALLDEAAATYYETIEDNPELGQRHSDKADLWVAELVHYDNQRRSGSGVFRIPIAGVTA